MAGKRFPYQSAFVACSGDGSGACAYGCISCGACVNACHFGAITLLPGHAAKADREKCRACGLCVKACPKGLIRLHEDACFIAVACSSPEEGRAVSAICPSGCIGCGLCEKNCTASAVKVKNKLAEINESTCLSCGNCAVRCPRGAIRDTRGILTN